MSATTSPRPSVLTWVVRVVAAAGIVVVAWCCVTAWPAIMHGHPLYPVLLLFTLALSVLIGLRSFRPRPASTRWRLFGRITLVVGSVIWISLMAWLRPFNALEPALAAMESDSRVTVAEYPTQIVLTPTGTESATGVFFQPGAKVEARAYAAILRPLAEAGHLVVIPKQPLGIAFLATNAFESTKSAYPQITRWVVGGHSLGGTVAAMDANDHDEDVTAPVVGLLLYASYPASDISSSLTSSVLSISASHDGLATPAKVQAAKADLPADATYITIDGAVHSFFGDYGPQPGDGSPTISQDDARSQISKASSDFLQQLSR